MLSGANIDTTDSPAVKLLTVPDFNLSDSQRHKSVRFVEDDKLVTELDFNCAEPWCIDRNTPNHVIIDKYAESCLKLNRPPLSTIIEQLSEIAAPLANTKIPVITLKGTQLCKEDIQGLEEIFKYCEVYHLNFENTNLTDNTLSDLLDALDYYKPCSELCLARNKKIASNGIEVIGNFISTYTSLTWLDLRGIPLLVEDVKHLRRAIIRQCDEARKAITDFLGKCSGQEPVNPDSARDAEEDPEAFRLTFNAFISKSLATPAALNTISGALQRLPPLCLRGLHLGETGIYGTALADIATAIRLAGHLRDLRLNGNRMGPRDIETLAPLLRYHPNLQVIDLSNNDLGVEGFRLLSGALSHPSYPSYFLRSSSADDADGESGSRKEAVCNLRRIYLSATGLCSAGAKHFSTCLPTLVNLTHLELSNNPLMGCQGMIALRSSLQAHSRKHLVYLGLANCGLACQGAIALAEILGDSPRALRRIDLTGNHIAEAGFMALSKSVPLCSRLVHLQGLEDNRPIATSETKGASIWTRHRSTNRTPTLLEPSKLSLDLIQAIHFQLAVNLDKHLVSHGRNAVNGGISGFPSLSLELDTESGGSSPFPHVGYIEGILNSATASILGQSGMSESATVHCFSFVRALSSLYLEVWNSLLIKAFIVWKDMGRIISPHRRKSYMSQGLRFFRGYVRIPPSTSTVRREIDPRSLCGDTSESEFSSSDSGEEEEEEWIMKETKEPSSSDGIILRTNCVDNR
ncbi:unnamed protein product [Rodentolepis nana]|uniref:Carm_PH domain-containing protein n=1 Tax=Rodentolepis nana TaxID=102285 RepID=A0A0R3TNN3_RODNA|nr:unnamed protein product [Rodentolepis nana]